MGSHHKKIERVFEGPLPRLMIVGLVSSSAFAGDVAKNPFLFQHFNLNHIQAYVDGTAVPASAFEPRWDGNKRSGRSYLGLMAAIGAWRYPHGPSITLDEYHGGNALFAFQLAPETNYCYKNAVVSGSVTLEMKFGQQLSESVNCIILAESDSNLYVNELRAVSHDFK